MIKRFLFDGIDSAGNNPAVSHRIQYPIAIGPNPAQTGITFGNCALMRTKLAMDPIALQLLVKLSLFH